MSVDKVQQAILLLTVFFNKTEVKSAKPLSPLEYSRFASWLHQQGRSPADLLSDADNILANWHDPKQKITTERLQELLARGVSMGFALEQWYKHGVWIISRASPDYPPAIRRHLGESRPPILFGIGSKELLNLSAIGFVGSRSVGDTDIVYTQQLARQAIDQGFMVVSGAAKGVDQTAMDAALQHGGKSVGVVSDSLIKTSTSRIYREAIQEGRLVLLSPYYPEAGFSTGNAMGRNKYIYTLSQAVVVVKSDYDEGGTWAGAIENLKKHWVPLLVRQCAHRGNQALIQKGAIPIGDVVTDFLSVTATPSIEPIPSPDRPSPRESVTLDLFADCGELPTTDEPVQVQPESPALETVTSLEVVPVFDQTEELPPTLPTVDQPETASLQQSDRVLRGTPLEHYGAVFGAFLSVMMDTVQATGSVTPTDLQHKLPELPASVIKKWLTELEQYQLIARQGRKLSYTLLNMESSK